MAEMYYTLPYTAEDINKKLSEQMDGTYSLSYLAEDIDRRLGLIEGLASKDELPTKLSDLINDKEYLTTNDIRNQYVLRPPALVSFIDDDCRIETYNKLFPVICDLNIPYAIACPPGNIGVTEGYMSLDHLMDMVNNENITITCHHKTQTNMNKYTSVEAYAADLDECIEWYEANGISNVRTVCYPQGVYVDEYMQVVRDRFAMGFTTSRGINQMPQESYYMRRCELFPTNDAYTLEDAKKLVNDVAISGGWLIFMTHAWYSTFDTTKLIELIQHINEVGNVEIVGIDEAISQVGNIVEIGEFHKPMADISNPYFVIDAVGNTYVNKYKSADLLLRTGKVISTTGPVVSTSDIEYAVSEKFNIAGLNSVIISGWASDGYGLYVFYDDAGNRKKTVYSEKSWSEGGDLLKDVEVQVPEGATQIAIAGYFRQQMPGLKIADTTTEIPRALADLIDDATHRTVTDAEKTAWNEKVDTSSLTSAVNDALLQAKESGEFKGESGVYVGSGEMPEGYNVQIDPNGDADIEVLTAEETKNLIVEEVAKLGQLKPEFANSIEECTDTSKLYVLPDGYIYAFISGGTQEVFTDVLKDVGYKEDHRINSSGDIVATDPGGPETTNYIPCKAGDIIRMKNVDFPSAYSSGKYWNLVGAYDANKTHKKQVFVIIDDKGTWKTLGLVEENGIVVQFTVEPSVFGTDIAYIAINAREITAESEIYVNSTFVSTDSWTNTGHAFIPCDDDGGSTVPGYVAEEAEAAIAKVFSHGNYGRTIRFIAISDTHEDSAGAYNSQISISNRHAGQAIKYIADRIGLDFVAHLGDASSRGAWTATQEFGVLCDDVMNINKFVFSGLRNTNTVFIPGNHDMMSLSGNQLLNSGAYILFGNMCSGTKDRLGGYGFFDIEDARVRVIYLNTSDSPTSAAYLALTQEQKNWLCGTMIDVNTKEDADEWKMILLSHAPLDFGGAKISEDILLSYVNGGVYGAYDFTNKNKAKIMCNIHGHVHCFSYGYMEDKIRRFSVPNACFIGSNHYGSRAEYADWTDTTTYNKTANSGKDTSFSLVTIDLDSGMCYVDNYGAGIDREFGTDYNTETVKHTNRILSSQESDGTPYNGGTGYKVGYRLNSTGVERAADDVVVSGFIPYNGEDIELRIPTNGETDSYNYLHIYGPDHGAFLVDADGNAVDGSYHQIGYWVTMFGATRVIDTTTNTMKLTIPKELVYKDAVYIRVSSRITAPLSADTFDVALNESVDN